MSAAYRFGPGVDSPGLFNILGSMNNDKSCSFCTPDVELEQEIARFGTIRFIYPKGPIIPQHVMLVPLRHVEHPEDLTKEEAADVMRAYGLLKKVQFDLDQYTGGNLFVNDGREAGQHVPHVHFHVFGRAEHETKNPYKVLSNLKVEPVEQLAKSEIRRRADRLKQALIVYI